MLHRFIPTFPAICFHQLGASDQTVARSTALALSAVWRLDGREYFALFGAACQARYGTLPPDFADRAAACLALQTILAKSFTGNHDEIRGWLRRPYIGAPASGENMTPLELMASGAEVRSWLLARLDQTPPQKEVPQGKRTPPPMAAARPA